MLSEKRLLNLAHLAVPDGETCWWLTDAEMFRFARLVEAAALESAARSEYVWTSYETGRKVLSVGELRARARAARKKASDE